MKKIAVLLLAAFAFNASFAQKMDKPVEVGGAPMYASKTLQSAGPFTVFAPTNDAFAKLPAGTVESLVKPENKATLTKILTYHVVAGSYDAKAIAKLIKEGNGTASLKTVSGGTLKASMKGNKIVLTDEKGGMSTITIKNVYQSNGVIHVVDTVVLPS